MKQQKFAAEMVFVMELINAHAKLEREEKNVNTMFVLESYPIPPVFAVEEVIARPQTLAFAHQEAWEKIANSRVALVS